MSWEKYELRHLCTEIIDCVNKTAPISPIPTEYKMLRTSDIRNGRVNLDNLNCVSYETFEKWTRRGKLQAGDIIFTREAPLGEVGLVKNPDNYFLGQRLVLFRANPQVCDNRFLLYALMYHDNKQAIIGKGVGSTVLHLRVPECEKITIKAPKLPMQHRIADILSAYDDLIENNRKQIKLLEEAAQRLYKEWFVDLHFPGHEHTKIVDGVPEGWEYIPLGKIVSYEIGGGWGEDVATGKNECPGFVIRGTDIDGINQGELLLIPYRFHAKGNLAARKLQDGDIIFEVSGGSKNTGVAKTLLITKVLLDMWEKPVMCASFCKLMRFDKHQIAQYIYDCLQYWRSVGETQEYEKKSASSIINYRWKDFLEQKCVMLPEEDLLQKYYTLSCSLYKKVTICSITICKAIQARDRLLPKLMSGEMEV